MATFYLINKTVLAGLVILPGDQIDDTVQDATGIRNAGGLLWPTSDAIVAAAAAKAQNAHKNRGASEAEMESIMQTAVQQSQQANDANNLTAVGSSNVATGVSPVIAVPGLLATSKIDINRSQPTGTAIAELIAKTSDRTFSPSGSFKVTSVRAATLATETGDFSTFDYQVTN